jgi:hypothetical protein
MNSRADGRLLVPSVRLYNLIVFFQRSIRVGFDLLQGAPAAPAGRVTAIYYFEVFKE